jgi:hypothetical protein
MNNFFFSFEQFINKTSIIKLEGVCNIKMKYGLIKIKINFFTQQTWWFGGKRVKFYPWNPRIKLQNDIVVAKDGILIEYSIPN